MNLTNRINLLFALLFTFLIAACSDEDIQDDLFSEPENVEQEAPNPEDSGEEETGDEGNEESAEEEETEEEPAEEEEAPAEEEPPAEEENEEEGNGNTNCSPSNYVFKEEDGLLVAEFEKADFPGAWEQKTNENGFSGDGYMVWTGNQYFDDPGNGVVRFKIKINNPGTYRFLWNSAVTMGNDGTEHNDTWLRFPDANDYFGEKGDNRLYPKGTGKSPNPNGSSKDGWFKIYRSGNDLSFKWQAVTSDHQGYNVFVKFNSPGIYTMEVSARSKGHAIDKFMLFKNMTKSEAVSRSNTASEISCGN